jgi:hypothetical protein
MAIYYVDENFIPAEKAVLPVSDFKDLVLRTLQQNDC